MAMISLKLNDEAHQYIKKKAKNSLRSVTAEINAIILNDMHLEADAQRTNEGQFLNI